MTAVHDQPDAVQAARLAIRFPLLPRTKPPGRALPRRIAEVSGLARSAVEQPPGTARLTRAAEALNKAALIASDCGMPDLARRLCWQQYDSLAAAAPLTAHTATLALQPITNLGRLALRAGDGEGAYLLFESAYRAVNDHAPALIEGRPLDLAHLVATPEDRRELRRFVWTVMLADGTRALCRSGRWHDAFRHIEQHKGIGRRLLDGRQVAVLAQSDRGQTDAALALLDDSAPQEPWEWAVAACLRTLCLRAAGRTSDTTAMVQHYVRLPPQPEQAAFQTRLGVTVADLVPAHRPGVVTRIVRDALSADDAHAASAVLSSAPCTAVLSAAEHRALTEMVDRSGFGRGTLPRELLDELLEATAASAEHIAVLLTTEEKK